MAPAKVLSRSAAIHPLDPPQPEEALGTKGVKAQRFTNVFLKEPPKADVIKHGFFPEKSTEPGAGPVKPSGLPSREIFLHVINLLDGRSYEAVVNLDDIDEPKVVDVKQLAEGVQPAITVEELVLSEEQMRRDQRVIDAAKAVGVSVEQLHADGWRREPVCAPARLQRRSRHVTGEVLAIDYPAHRSTKTGKLGVSTKPPTEASFDKPEGRERIPPPLERHDYLPDLAKRAGSDKPIEMRQDLKQLSVVQPQGVSFHREGNVLEWQKWKLHVGFHPREGIVLSTISYKDDDVPGASKAAPSERPLFYRLSLSEMVVPYAEPAHPHYRKFAFDVGEYGLGYMANSLSLGCDCLGSIEYLDGVIAKHDGTTETLKNVICIHEEDAGLLWKHTDYRPDGRAHNVRNRKLVISMVCTVANYEYQFNWNLHLDGNIELEIKLTGILNLYHQLAQGESTGGYGVEVAPRINAHLHQHLFSLRVDPHIDGALNSISEQTIRAVEAPSGSDENWAGNAFTANQRILQTTGEGVRDANLTRSAAGPSSTRHPSTTRAAS
ncbi:hypothetical protein L7F22_007298 [Adiantum nelumboides]|nr:hypothetical protein [Adiantum nelumboides]